MKNYFLRTCLAAALVSVVIIPSFANANEWANVHPGYYFQKGELITPDKINYRDTKVQPHCEMFTAETTPGRLRTVVGHAVSQGIVGGGATAAQTATQAAMLSQHLISGALPAVGVASLVGNFALGGLNGNTLTNERIRSGVVGCLVRDAGGIYSLAPSEAKKILEDGKPRTASISSNWGPADKPTPGVVSPAAVTGQ